MADGNPQLDALLELERRHMAGDNGINEDQWKQIKSRLDAYRAQGLAKPLGGTRALSSTDRKQVEGDVSSYAALKNSGSSFNPEFAGNTITGGLENSIQALSSDFGTPGQRNWWANFRATDNQIRNSLFGSTLTDNEKRAYEETTISERMDPEIIQENLAKRAEIIRAALARRDAYFKKAGYDAEAIDALTGEYAADLLPDYKAPELPSARRKREQEEADAPPPIDDENGLIAPPVHDDRPTDPPPGVPGSPSRGDKTTSTISDLATLGRQGITLGLSDEAAGVGGYISGLLTGEDPRAAYTRERDAARNDIALARKNSPVLGSVTEFLGGGGAAGVASIPSTIGGIFRQGAALGGIGGFGYGEGAEGSTLGTLAGAATGGVASAALGGGFRKLGTYLRSRRAPTDGDPAAAGRNVASAARDLGIDVLPADVGGPATRRITAGAVQTPFGSGPILSRASRATEQAQGVRDRVASSLTSPTDDYGAGRAAQRGLTGWLKKSETRAGRLYDAVSVPAKQDASTSNTISALEQITQGMESNPELSRIWTGHPRLRATLEAIRRPEVRETSNAVGYPIMQKKVGDEWVNLTQQEIQAGAAQGGGVSWEDMKRLRSIVGEIVGSPSLASEGSDTAAMRKLYAALSEDMRATAERAGPTALREFERANSFFRARENRIENVISPILGKDSDKGAQAAFNQIQNWSRAKGETARLAQMIRSLPADEAETVSATIISKLGQANPGAQNAQGSGFSLSQFLTHWNQLDRRAKSAIFTPSQREAMDKLAVVAEGTKESQRFANTSNTAGALGTNATTGGLATAGVLALTGHPVLAITAASPAAGQYLTGRMMASPKFVNWLVRTPRSGPGLISHIEKLGKISVQSPLLASELSQFQQGLLRAMNDNMPQAGRVAASPNEGPDQQERPE